MTEIFQINGSNSFMMKSETTNILRCFLCDRIFVDGETPWLIFEKRLRNNGEVEPPLAVILANALGRELDQATEHSALLCDECNSCILEFESLEQRFYEIRFRILKTYNRMARNNHLSTICVEIDGVLHEADDDDNYGKLIKSNSDSNVQPDVDTYDSNVIVDSEVSNFIVKEEILGDHQKLTYSILNEEQNMEYVIPNNNFEESNTIIDEEDFINSVVIEEPYEKNYSDSEDTCCSQESPKILNDINNENQIATINSFSKEVIVKESSKEFKDSKQFYKQHGKNYICLLCPFQQEFVAKVFTDHLRNEHNVVQYACKNCFKLFCRLSEVKAHMDEQHNDGQIFKCETCLKEFSSYRLRRVHERSHHGIINSKQYPCPECHKKYNSKNLLEEHINMHTGSRPYKCTHCPKDFASKYTLIAHTKIHTDRERPFKCKSCGKCFLNYQNLNQHAKLHIGIKSFICDICSKAFGTQHNLDVHKIVHTGVKPFICRTCGKSFARRPEVQDHERIHTGERPFKCDVCPMAFAQRSNLTTHKKTTHLNQKLHQCDQCDRSFKRRRLLEYHINAVHTGVRPFKCNICYASFVYPEHYKKHMLIHSDKKPFSCEVCGKQFNSRDNRNAHRFIHSEKKPYECVECGAGFMRKPMLMAHMKTVGHLTSTFIVNQPIFNKKTLSTMKRLVSKDEAGEISMQMIKTEEEIIDVSNTELLQKEVESIKEEYIEYDNEEIEIAFNDPDGQLIKDNKYLHFEKLNEKSQQSYTWVDVKSIDGAN